MKISENWLRQWVNPNLTAEQIGEQLTMAGLELDELTKVAKDFAGVVVGQVVDVQPHPDADKLCIATVNVGEANQGELLQIVCGAPNVAPMIKVPVALIGATLPPVNGDDKPFKIKKGKLRGAESHGMLCGASEIDLEDEVDGLLILPDDAPIGMNVRDYLQLDNHILDISITPNRGDCFSIRGIAREVAVLNNLSFQLPFEPVTSSITTDAQQAVTITTDDCPRYYAQVVSNLDGGMASPAFIKQALLAAGVRPRNLLVDVTNYVLLELGQPLHAFDADKIVGTIEVRKAKPQENLQLLNEQTIELNGDELVIADEQGAIALAGIMGGLRTAVSEQTSRVVIESAFFNPLAIAGRARRFGLHTDASQRYERGVDFDLPKLALDRVVNILNQYGGGQVGQITLAENTNALPQRNPIMLPLTTIKRLLGIAIETDKALQILNDLQIDAHLQDDQIIAVPPSHRYDLSLPEDLVEEIARIYGYNNIANQLPAFSTHFYDSQIQNDIHTIKTTLVNNGYYEAVSFSFSDAKVEQLFDNIAWAQPLTLANPISKDLAVMRRSLLSSLLPCVQYNLNRQQTRVRLFETGLRFVGDQIEHLQQIESLGLVAVGDVLPEQPSYDKPMDFFDLKHDIEALLPAQLWQTGNISYQRSQMSFLHPGQSADIIYQGEPIGWFGQLHPQIAKALNLPTTWVAQLDLQLLKTLRNADYSIIAPSKFPQVRRDIAILVDKTIEVQRLLSAIRQNAGELLKEVYLFDVYEGEKLPADKRSLAFALTWQDPKATLADEIIASAMSHIVKMLNENYQATLRD